MTTPDGSRGGSVPPRHPAAGQPQQWFTLRPWVFDVTLAGVLLRATPRPPVPIPVADWVRAYGLPLAELADEDGTPRWDFIQQANHTFDKAEAENAGKAAYQPYPAVGPRHLGLIAEAALAERAAMREAVASAMAAPGTSPESPDVTLIIERLRAGEKPVDIARETGALP